MSAQAQPNILKSSFKVTIIKMAGSLAGFIAILLIARRYGSNESTDAFFIGRLLPIIISTQIARALPIALIPVFSKIQKNEGEDACRSVTASTISTVGAALLILTLLFAVCSKWILHLQAPGFAAEQYTSAWQITLTLLPLFWLLGTNAVIEAFLNLKHMFLPAELASASYSFGTMFGIFALAPKLGLVGVAVGTSAGAIIGFVLLWAFAYRQFKLVPSFDFKPGLLALRSSYKALISIFYGVSAGQAATIVAQGFATTLGDGMASIFNYATRIVIGFPFVAGMAIGKVLMPRLSSEANSNEQETLRKSVGTFMRGIFFFFAPYALSFFLLRDVLVELLFSNNMQVEDLTHLSQALAAYSPAILFGTVNIVLLRTFHSLNSSTVIFRSSTLFLLVNLPAIYLLANVAGFGVAGLAGAYSLATGSQMLGLTIILSSRLGTILDSKFVIFVLKLIFAMVLATIPVWLLLPAQPFLTAPREIIISAIAASTLMMACWISALTLLRVPEMQMLLKTLSKRLTGRKTA